MICKICGKDIAGDTVKIKKGRICRGCYNSLPMSFKQSAAKLTAADIKDGMTIVKGKYSTPWATCEGIGICYQSIQVNGFEIRLKDIKKIRLNFHPDKRGSSEGYVRGEVCVTITTVNPCMEIEEPFFRGEVKYYISGREIYYSYPTNVQQMFGKLQYNIDHGIYDTDNLRTKKKKDEGRTRDEYHRQKQKEAAKTEFEAAKELFGVRMPFTMEVLEKQKKALAKLYHPDMTGGDDTMFKKVMNAYDLLVKYADQ